MKSLRIVSLFCFILLIPFTYFIRFNQYPLFKPEILIIGSLLLLLGIAAAMLYRFATWWLRILLIAACLTIAFSFLPSMQTAWVLGTVFLIALLLGTWLGEHFIGVLLVCSLVFNFANLLLPIKTQLTTAAYQEKLSEPAVSNLPPVVDIVLDEHAGIAGLPPELNGFREHLTRFYLQQGFKLYSRAYSHYVHTVDAIPNFLNFSQDDREYHFLKVQGKDYYLTQNRYFKLLADKGYVFRIYQSNNIDFCRQANIPLASCYIYPIASLKSLNEMSLPLQQRIQFILKDFLIESALYRSFVDTYQFLLSPFFAHLGYHIPPWFWYQSRLNSLPFLTTMQQIKADILAHPKGTVFFAHILTPHSPYVFDENCQVVKDTAAWDLNIGPDPLVNTIMTRHKRYALYQRQLVCVQKQVAELFKAMQAANIYQQAIIVIEGDHGSRITLRNPTISQRHLLSRQDLADCYATLFAVKAPGIKAGIDVGQLPLEVLQARVLKLATGIDLQVDNKNAYVDLLPPEGEKQMLRWPLSDFK